MIIHNGYIMKSGRSENAEKSFGIPPQWTLNSSSFKNIMLQSQ